MTKQSTPSLFPDDNIIDNYHKLLDELKRHDEAYHQQDAPLISDAIYDEMKLRLEKMEEDYPSLRSLSSPTQTVGAPPARGFKKVIHRVPMLSLG
ncbi:MAG: hypothetical protein AAB276_03680, partial [Pseudomonadota bacterium]